MIRVSQLKINIERMEGKEEKKVLLKEIAKLLRIDPSQIQAMEIMKKSIDARKKPLIKYIYTVDVAVDQEKKLLAKIKNDNVTQAKRNEYSFAPTGTKSLTNRPIVIGTGPAGLFAAYMLAKHGYKPLVLERGADVDTRVLDVERFWKTNELNPESNVQFGEGGAGTFSDGKLNTVVKDPQGKNRLIYKTFVDHGAPEEILYQNKPHIGTDRLRDVVRSMREEIIAFGGEVRFHSKVTDLIYKENQLTHVVVNDTEHIPCEVAILAIGHSARDTFEMLHKKGCSMEKKNFAVGVRIEHPQQIINESQYGEACTMLPAAEYKVTHQAENGRSIYSFCMCPGGFVVNSSSEEGYLVVNGMSNYKRDGKNANSAMIVGVSPEDFEDDSVLAGMHFQRKWEKAAYEIGNGLVPVQRFEDFKANQASLSFGEVTPNIEGTYTLANVRKCLPEFVSETIVEGIEHFETKIKGFANPDALLVGIETRTSSPVRIKRDEALESNIKGLYPCGEGAGYAGGITSAAIDGIRVFEAIASVYVGGLV